ncbi:MAG: hypothetical protein AABW56_01345 [Nanoarchaeota archaeon]
MTEQIIPDIEEVKASKLIGDIRNDLSSLEDTVLDRDNETELGEVEKIPHILDNLDFLFKELHYQFVNKKIDEVIYRKLNTEYENLKYQSGF